MKRSPVRSEITADLLRRNTERRDAQSAQIGGQRIGQQGLLNLGADPGFAHMRRLEFQRLLALGPGAQRVTPNARSPASSVSSCTSSSLSKRTSRKR